MDTGQLVVLGLILLVLVGIARKVVRTRVPSTDWPLFVHPVLSEPEQVLYHRLVKALPESIVLAQVQLSRFLIVKGATRAQAVRNRIDRKSVDFLICRRDFSIRAAIELDDKSHQSTKQKGRDNIKNEALAAAGLELIRYNVKQLPSEEEIRTRFLTADLPPIKAMR